MFLYPTACVGGEFKRYFTFKNQVKNHKQDPKGKTKKGKGPGCVYV